MDPSGNWGAQEMYLEGLSKQQQKGHHEAQMLKRDRALQEVCSQQRKSLQSTNSLQNDPLKSTKGFFTK
jgi:hypothetical protein